MKIFLDGALVKQVNNFLNMGGEYNLGLKNHSCSVIVRPVGNLYDYDFAVNGISVVTGKPADRLEET